MSKKKIHSYYKDDPNDEFMALDAPFLQLNKKGRKAKRKQFSI